uniref:Uncharacterized protein n=1 Tax=Nelumbo nucifera TaxID=4432 RepID=A0A822XIF0_NELNU|nr:TPA_asm: hypothetical protein HUJ06_020282 [Nelumbo nucifera]
MMLWCCIMILQIELKSSFVILWLIIWRCAKEKNVPETSGDALVREAIEDCSAKQDDAVDVDLSQAQITTALGEGELGESRIRFRQ